jgi:hypothetical protein
VIRNGDNVSHSVTGWTVRDAAGHVYKRVLTTRTASVNGAYGSCGQLVVPPAWTLYRASARRAAALVWGTATCMRGG